MDNTIGAGKRMMGVGKQIVVDIRYDQTRVAVLEDGDLVEFYMEDDEKQGLVGNIYRGRVVNVLPGMHAAFVDIGLEKNAFLYAGDINIDNTVFDFKDKSNGKEVKNISLRDIVREGQEITVQILKEPMGTKGARVTTHITLPGRYVVLMPTLNYVGVSRRIEDEEERQRLRKVAEAIKPQNMGVIVRTAAKGKQAEDLMPDIEVLCKLWEGIREREKQGEVPRLLHKDESLLYRTVRDIFSADVDRLVINDYHHYQKVVELVKVVSPSLVDRVEYFDAQRNLFEIYGIEAKIEKAIQKKVWLKSGGYIVIDVTEALTVIDVNTGKFVGNASLEDTAFKTNLEAAEEIAHQIRLRDIGGIIIIDFIDMEEDEHKKKVLEVLEQALKKDRTRTNLVGLTGLGLVELTRKKVRPRLSTAFLKPCPYCNGTGRVYSESTVIAKIEKELEKLFSVNEAWGALVEVHPSVANAWMEDKQALEQLETTLKKKICIRADESIHVEDSRIKLLKGPGDLEKVVRFS
ncbi:ribonuclease G [Caldicoprobacter guelmensis]|uniref:Rne/Rng family ribonuclease n=1 Tax=Caldicoprobacter guelmensis TaxID=1170224 RepID=UPI001FAFB531|nr:Rne/Rng family ribonuclease [Caldicoprobacter guelmensis]MBM7583074.1 ribonuclease G [Caldicoprobacter guelmensis]